MHWLPRAEPRSASLCGTPPHQLDPLLPLGSFSSRGRGSICSISDNLEACTPLSEMERSLPCWPPIMTTREAERQQGLYSLRSRHKAATRTVALGHGHSNAMQHDACLSSGKHLSQSMRPYSHLAASKSCTSLFACCLAAGAACSSLRIAVQRAIIWSSSSCRPATCRGVVLALAERSTLRLRAPEAAKLCSRLLKALSLKGEPVRPATKCCRSCANDVSASDASAPAAQCSCPCSIAVHPNTTEADEAVRSVPKLPAVCQCGRQTRLQKLLMHQEGGRALLWASKCY